MSERTSLKWFLAVNISSTHNTSSINSSANKSYCIFQGRNKHIWQKTKPNQTELLKEIPRPGSSAAGTMSGGKQSHDRNKTGRVRHWGPGMHSDCPFTCLVTQQLHERAIVGPIWGNAPQKGWKVFRRQLRRPLYQGPSSSALWASSSHYQWQWLLHPLSLLPTPPLILHGFQHSFFPC